MAEFEESVEGLQAKLQQYAEQLDQVKEALKVQPEEAALVKLQSDLEEVISLTKDLISFQTQTQAEAAAAEKSGEASAAVTPTGAAGAAASSTAAAAEPAAPAAAAAVAEKAEPAVAAAAGHVTASAAPAPAASRLTHSAASDTSVVGRTCVAEYEGKKFYAEILELRKSKQGETVLVEFIGWKNQKEYATHQVQLLAPVAPSAVPPGSEAQAIYSEDGKWYDCIIHEHTCGGYKVTYSDYGNSEEVKFDQVRLRKKKSAAAAADAARRRIKEIVTPGGYKIPHYLALKPTDTEAQRNSKKRRIKAIKLQQQQERAEEEAQERARSWQKFNKRAVNKRMAGFISGRGHESMFSGFEVKSTVSINVLGSQRTRANSFIPRRKHDVDLETLQDD